MRALALTSLIALAACGSPTPTEPQTDQPVPKVEQPVVGQTTGPDCVAKGEAYFREIESWPTLSDGRDAGEVAAERCARTTGAFDGLN